MNTDCLFCKIVQGEIPAAILYQDEQVTAFRDINPQAPTHVLVIPNQHVADLSELNLSHGETLARIVHVLNEIAKSEGISESGYRILANTGADAHQEVFHLHFHLFGGRALGPMLSSGA